MSGKEEDPTWALLLIVTLTGGALWAIWHFFQGEILQVLRVMRVAELALQSPFDSHSRSCLQWLWAAKVGETILPTERAVQTAQACYGPSLQALQPVEALRFYNLTSVSFLFVTKMVSPIFRVLSVLACGGVIIYAMYYTPLNRYRVKHSLESFIKMQSTMWPVISPIVSFKPSSISARVPGGAVPDKLPVFAEALSPEEWIAFHRIAVENSVPDREASRRAFLAQLGPRWRGTKTLPPYLLGLFAAFALQGVQRREECDVLLGKLSMAWSLKGGFRPSPDLLREIRKHAEDPAVGGKALQIASKHAFRATAMLGVLKWARFMGGVLAPAQFLWLRAVDRNLWYPMNNLGRRSFHTEGAGAMAHFMAESGAGKALPIPRIETAIVTLNTYFAKSNVKVPDREEPAAVKGRSRTALA